MSCEHLVCAQCSGPVAEGRCVVCRAARTDLHSHGAGLSLSTSGVLSGKFTRDQRPVGTRLGDNEWGRAALTERNLAIAAEVERVAREVDRSSSQVALAWVRAQKQQAVREALRNNNATAVKRAALVANEYMTASAVLALATRRFAVA